MKPKVIRLNSKKNFTKIGPSGAKLIQSDIKVSDKIEQTFDQIPTPRDFSLESNLIDKWDVDVVRCSIQSSPLPKTCTIPITSNIVDGLLIDSEEKEVAKQYYKIFL